MTPLTPLALEPSMRKSQSANLPQFQDTSRSIVPPSDA
jgi:hypothetical protein